LSIGVHRDSDSPCSRVLLTSILFLFLLATSNKNASHYIILLSYTKCRITQTKWHLNNLLTHLWSNIRIHFMIHGVDLKTRPKKEGEWYLLICLNYWPLLVHCASTFWNTKNVKNSGCFEFAMGQIRNLNKYTVIVSIGRKTQKN